MSDQRHRCRVRGCPFVIPAALDYCAQHADTDHLPAWISTTAPDATGTA